MTPKLKKIIIALLILTVLFIGYAILKPDPTAEVLINNRDRSASAVTSQQARLISAQISQALLKLDQIKLDRAIFSNPIYDSLQDKSQNIEPEPVGRNNPFAPLGENEIVVSETTASSTDTVEDDI